MTIDEVIQLIKKEFERNYKKGNTKVPPHQHDGIDNLQLNPNNFLGYKIFSVKDATIAPTDTPVSGTIRFQYDGTHFTMWVRNATAWSQVGGGGGAGSPGGSDTNVQYNSSGSFAGSNFFDFQPSYAPQGGEPALILDDGSADGYYGVVITGGTSGIAVTTDTQSVNSFTGDVSIFAGDNSSSGGTGGSTTLTAGNAPSDGFPGNIDIGAGSCGDLGTPGTNPGGDISISAGNTGTSAAGFVLLQSGNATSTGVAGQIILNLGGVGVGGTRSYVQVRQYDAFGFVQPNVYLGNSVSFGGGQGVLGMANRTTAPSGTPSGGGILYIEAGALMYKGSSGTVTTVAPA